MLSFPGGKRSGMTKEIKALPDKELDLDLKFEVRAQSKRQTEVTLALKMFRGANHVRIVLALPKSTTVKPRCSQN